MLGRPDPSAKLRLSGSGPANFCETWEKPSLLPHLEKIRGVQDHRHFPSQTESDRILALVRSVQEDQSRVTRAGRGRWFFPSCSCFQRGKDWYSLWWAQSTTESRNRYACSAGVRGDRNRSDQSEPKCREIPVLTKLSLIYQFFLWTEKGNASGRCYLPAKAPAKCLPTQS